MAFKVAVTRGKKRSKRAASKATGRKKIRTTVRGGKGRM